MGPILYRLGRVMQLIGLVLLPIAIAGNLSPDSENRLKLWTSLTISGVGVTFFIVGYMLQNAGRPN